MTSGMTEFDFERAWAELARPEFEKLPDEIHGLLSRVCESTAEIHQDMDTLDLPWPSRDEGLHYELSLKEAFEKIDSFTLARSARTVYCYGHWASGKVAPVALTDKGARVTAHGGTWKFANYADQILSARLDLPRRRRESKRGASLVVLEGTLRLQYADRDSWTWRELGWATEQAYKRVEESLLTKYDLTGERGDDIATGKVHLEGLFAKAVTLVRGGSTERSTDSFGRWDTDRFNRFMVAHGTWAARREVERLAENDRLVNEKALATAVAALYSAGDERSAERAIQDVFIHFGVSPELRERVLKAASNLSGSYVYRPSKPEGKSE